MALRCHGNIEALSRMADFLGFQGPGPHGRVLPIIDGSRPRMLKQRAFRGFEREKYAIWWQPTGETRSISRVTTR